MKTEFITSASDASGFPKLGLPEVAFVGRSNVGKSSLLNCLLGAKLARTSRTPGRTQLANFFGAKVDGFELVLADLPGFGFANVPKSVQAEWYGLIEAYLDHRRELALSLLLIDIRRGIAEDDREVFEWLGRGKRSVWVLATKADKVPKAKRKPAAHKIASALEIEKNRVLPVSATSGEGIVSLRADIVKALRRGGNDIAP